MNINKYKEICNLDTITLQKRTIVKEIDINRLTILTNCNDGNFHDWIFKSNDLICNKCNSSYNELIKLLPISNKINYLDKIKINNLKELSKKYCLNGLTHELKSEGICNLCHININTYEPSDNELIKLEKNIENKKNKLIIENINLMKKYNEKINNINKKKKKILNKFNKRYKNNCEDSLEKYIDKFIDKLILILGNKIKIDEYNIYLKDTLYIIDHDYLGNYSKNIIYITSLDNKILFYKNHPIFSKDILYYNDKANKVFVYYDFITLQYLGYSSDNKKLIKTINKPSLIINLSIKDSLLLLGYENIYYNLYHINKDYDKEYIHLINNNDDINQDIILNIIRNRINNLKQIIVRTFSIIYNIINNGKIVSIYNIDEKNIINKFNKRLHKIKLFDENNHNKIFKNNKYIIDNIFIKYNISNIKLDIIRNYINISNILLLKNADSKILFYLVYNLNNLLDYNKKSQNEIDIAYLIIEIIRYLFNIYYRPYSNYNIRKFDYLLINEVSYANDTVKVVGNYQELLTQQEIDDPNIADEKYSNLEAVDALDIDDYDVDDDIDNRLETLGGDGYEE